MIKCKNCEHYHKYSEYVTAGWCSKKKIRVQWGDTNYKGFSSYPNCEVFKEKWIPTFTHRKCKNPLCNAELPMDSINIEWGGTLASVMFECHECGRLDGEIWDISKKELIIEKCYMQSKYGDVANSLLGFIYE